jgi:hypothetical protein
MLQFFDLHPSLPHPIARLLEWFNTLQTIFRLCIPKQDSAKTHWADVNSPFKRNAELTQLSIYINH